MPANNSNNKFLLRKIPSEFFLPQRSYHVHREVCGLSISKN
jgi:hypothetical protein